LLLWWDVTKLERKEIELHDRDRKERNEGDAHHERDEVTAI